MKDLKNNLLALIASCWALGFTSAQQNDKILGITVLYRSPTCETFCRIQFTANKERKAIIKTPGIDMHEHTDRMLQRKIVDLDPTDWKELLATFSMEEIKAMPKTMGCPGCNDDPAGTLFVATIDTTYQIDYEALEPPEAIRKLTGLLTGHYLKHL